LGAVAFALGGCARASSAKDGARDAEASEIMRARGLADGQGDLPDRAEALAMAASLEGLAEREGASGRSVSLRTTGAQLLERLWRVDSREQDAKQAIDLYRAASREVDFPGACAAALAAARLAGDVARDASATYAELYHVERGLAAVRPTASSASGPCRSAVGDALRLLVGFRPPREVLEAIDDGLSSAGAMAGAGDSGATTQVAPPHVTRIEWWPGQDAARVVLVFDRPATYRVAEEVPPGGGAQAVVVDLQGVEWGSIPTDIAAQGIVTRIRSQVTSTGSRLWLDTDGRALRRVFEMSEPYRVVLDIARGSVATQNRGSRMVSRVVLDPGHGGWDRGAHGPRGVEEKEVVLDIARRVAPVLETQGIQVSLTRDEDRFVSLEERTGRANAFGADLFVSIHCNASEGRVRRGVEAYVLDTGRDEIAARVAVRENATTHVATTELATILSSMRIADEGRRSRRLAQLLLRAATTALQSKYGDAVDGGVHAAGFYVLVGARMPAVLFETSYISNATDEQRLASADYRQLLADAVVNAVRAYREGR
jgi:N-acetylmuramoyl-L-alanine amidase